jgi:hypothetical protein
MMFFLLWYLGYLVLMKIYDMLVVRQTMHFHVQLQTLVQSFVE